MPGATTSKLGRARCWLRLATACLSFGVAWACGAPSVESSPSDFSLGDGAAESLTLPADVRVEYIVDWSWDGAGRSGAGYRFKNDLGYSFQIDEFRVATYSAQLITCEPTAWLHWGLSVAHAHHVAINDPSMYVAERGEDALSERFTTLGFGTAAGGEYCSAFLLFTPLAEGAPELGGNAIWFSGTYTDADGDAQPLQGQIPQGDGALGSLASAIPSAIPLDGDAARVVFVRFPVRAFDGIDPSDLSDLKLGWEVLKGLVATTEVRWQLASD
ncbi:MAG: hypothetical protein R3B07_17970 [Polyangiaceae bacterium]